MNKSLPSVKICMVESENQQTTELARRSYVGSPTGTVVLLRFADPACQVCAGTNPRKHG